MLFIAICTDKPDSLAVRMDARPAHLAWLGSLGDRVRVGGALLAPDQKSVVGSMLIFAAADEAEVAALLAEDPYTKAGVFVGVDIKPWRQAVGVALA
jgi:uncharacterized protein